MSAPSSPQRERLLDLLASRATEGLDRGDAAELEELLASDPEVRDDPFEKPAAVLHLAFARTHEAMPKSVEDKVREQATAYLRAVETPPPANDIPDPETRPHAPIVSIDDRRPSRSAGLGWMAAAASLAVAAVGWWMALTPAQPPDTVAETPVQEAPADPLAALVSANDLLRIDWTATEDPAATAASGEVLWSNTRQAGLMRFRGLEANDPTVSQYQLWIFDENQDERHPIDGGVFDVGPNGEVTVAIDAKLQVQRPTLFAVTVEKPGGVVVSSRERIVLVASVA